MRVHLMKFSIDLAAIEKKQKQFEKSREGKKKIKEFLDDCVENGVGKTEGGSAIVTKEMMEEAARLMIQILKNTAASKSLPDSVMVHFNSLDYSQPVKIPGSKEDRYMIEIFFTDDLSRFSLRIASGPNKGKYTGEGIDNIISLFDTGYPKKDNPSDNYAIGIWDGHEDAGVIRGRKERDGLHFMLDAVDAFNMSYSNVYGVEAYIADPDSTHYDRGNNG